MYEVKSVFRYQKCQVEIQLANKKIKRFVTVKLFT